MRHDRRDTVIQESRVQHAGATTTSQSLFQQPLFWALLVMLMTMTFVVFRPMLDQEFTIWDDGAYVFANPHVATGLSSQNTIWAFTTQHQANYHPLTWLSLQFDAQIYGLKPSGFKLTSLLFHIANAVLVFILFKLLTRADWPSFFVAALFAIHPLHVESVAWITERKDTLSTFFVLLALIVYFRYTRNGSWLAYGGMNLLFAMSLLSKQMYVTLPFLLLFIDYWPLNRMKQVSIKKLVGEKILPLAIAIAAAVGIYVIQGEGAANQRLDLPLSQRLMNVVASYGVYIVQTFIPMNLSFFYPFPQDGDGLFLVAASGAFVILVSLFAIFVRTSYPEVFVGWYWYLVTLLPVIGLVQVGFQSHADRYTYFPLIGIFVMLIYPLDRAAKWRRDRQFNVVMFGFAMLIGLGILARLQVETWKTSRSLAMQGIAATDRNDQAHLIVGFDAMSHGRWQEASEHFEKAVEYDPVNASNLLNSAVALLITGQTDNARERLKKVIVYLPNESNSNRHLGILAMANGDWKGALEYLDRSNESVQDDLTTLARGVTYARMGDLKKASEILAPFKSRNPEIQLAAKLIDRMKAGSKPAEDDFKRLFTWPATVQGSRLMIAHATPLMNSGEISRQQAIRICREALDLWPLNVDAKIKLCTLLNETGQKDEAKKIVGEIQFIDPSRIKFQ